MKNTLFNRYKDFINFLWEHGDRSYTSKQLNNAVGDYENSTPWKKWNNNPYYTTRSYQTLLKQLGCITMIKRGQWQINGPIPNWFSGYHLNALTSRWALQDLEKTSTYWKSLPAEHKVNPWKIVQTAAKIDAALNGGLIHEKHFPEPNKHAELDHLVQNMDSTTYSAFCGKWGINVHDANEMVNFIYDLREDQLVHVISSIKNGDFEFPKSIHDFHPLKLRGQTIWVERFGKNTFESATIVAYQLTMGRDGGLEISDIIVEFHKDPVEVTYDNADEFLFSKEDVKQYLMTYVESRC